MPGRGSYQRLRAIVVNTLRERYRAGDKSGMTITDVIKLTKLSYESARRIMVEIAAIYDDIRYESGRLYVVESGEEV